MWDNRVRWHGIFCPLQLEIDNVTLLLIGLVGLVGVVHLFPQARGSVPRRDQVGHVDLKQPVREVLLRTTIPHREGGLQATIQPRPSGENERNERLAIG